MPSGLKLGRSAVISSFGGGFSFIATESSSQNCSGSLKSNALTGWLGSVVIGAG